MPQLSTPTPDLSGYGDCSRLAHDVRDRLEVAGDGVVVEVVSAIENNSTDE